MDPDANLYEQIALARTINHGFDNVEPIEDFNCARLATLVVELDEWIRKGGFLPQRWAGPHQ